MTARTDAQRPLPSATRRLLEFSTLSGFAVAQPIFSVFGSAPEEFVFRRVDRLGVFLFTTAVVALPPLLLWVIGLVAARVRPSVGVIVHDVLMGALWLTLSIEALQRLRWLPMLAIFLVSILVAAGAVVLGITAKEFRLWVTFASPAPLVFALVFLVFSPVSDQVLLSGNLAAKSVSVGNPAPVIVVVLDEFPVASLIGRDGQIATDLYPNLAALASQSNVFLNATSNAWTTTLSVPSLLTGRLPSGDRLPVATTHPDNLFTLLGKSYDLRAHELLSMCPVSLCPREAPRGLLPQGFSGLMLNALDTYMKVVDPRQDGFGKNGAMFGDANDAMLDASLNDDARAGADDLLMPARFDGFLSDLNRPSTQRPPLAFLHLLIPHAPWVLLPDGRKYAMSMDQTRVLGAAGDVWRKDGKFLALARQRHVLQVQFADRLVGQLVMSMQENALWDKSLVVLTADHGVSFQPGQSRRDATRKNVDELARVPLIIKTPNQQSGGTSLRPVQLIDVLPTIAEVLRVEVPWNLQGRSVFSMTSARSRPRRFLVDRDKWLSVDTSPPPRALALSEFAPRVDDPLRVYRVGPSADLIGRELPSLPKSRLSGDTLSGSLDNRESWAKISLKARVIPAYATGKLRDPTSTASSLIIGVNGKIAAVSELTGDPADKQFAALIPPSLLKEGDNVVRLFAIDASGRLLRVPVD